MKSDVSIAKNYLDKYVNDLQSKNILRMASLTDIYEKNVIIYYKAHLEWLTSLAKSIAQRDNKFFPEINHNLCTFGKWLLSDGKNIIQIYIFTQYIKSPVNKFKKWLILTNYIPG